MCSIIPPTARIRFRALLFALYLSLGMAACGADPVEPINLNKNPAVPKEYLTIEVNEVTIRSDSIGDLTGRGEFRFYIILSTPSRSMDGLFCPAGNPRSIQPGDRFPPCSTGISVPIATLDEDLYVLLLGVDEDRGSMISTIGNDVIVEGLSQGLEMGLDRLIESQDWTDLVADVAGVSMKLALSVVVNTVGDAIRQEDVIGVQILRLNRSRGWGSGDRITFTTSDGGLDITMQVSLSNTPERIAGAGSGPTPIIIVVTATEPGLTAPNTPTPRLFPTATEPAITLLPDPLAMLAEYHKAINNLNYKKTWDMLTDGYKAANPSVTFEAFKDFWGAISQVTILDTNTVQITGNAAYIVLELQYEFTNGVVKREQREYDLVYSESEDAWQIDDTNFLRNLP